MPFFRRIVFHAILLAPLVVLSTPLQAQSCNSRIYASTPSDQFREKTPGTITDTKTELMWMRCTMGMLWKGGSCTDVAANFVWQDVKYDIEQMNRQGGYAGHTDWRLPTLKELEGIVEHRCIDPAVNAEIFPGTPSTGFWSSTRDKDYKPGVWLVYFLHGKSYMGNAQQEWKVRLVRDAQ